MLDYLYFLELGSWTVKIRATMGASDDVAEEARIDAFVRALPWAQILAANGACTGRACTAPAFDAIDNHFVQISLPPLLSRIMPFDERAEARLAVTTTTEIPLVGRSEIRRSDGQPLVYVTSVPRLATYRLVRLPEPFTPLFAETFGRISVAKPLYALAVDVGGESFVPRFFHGEPTAEAFAAAVGELVIDVTPNPMMPVAEAARRMRD